MNPNTHYAETAAHSVIRTFSTTAFKIPGTLLGAVTVPDFRNRKEKFTRWHYWWQAHFLDNIIDAAHRAHTHQDTDTAHQHLHRAHALLRGIQVRNFSTYINNYYDDMAWLALATQRLNALSYQLTGTGSPQAQDAGTTLYRQLTRSIDQKLGGGAYWSKARDFKNTPANAPIALAFTRAHRHQEASQLINWLHANLWDPTQNVYLDGISLKGNQPTLETGRYSYNSGPVLGALIELPETYASTLNFNRTTHIHHIIEGVFTHYTTTFTDNNGNPRTVLASGGTGDGGLFPGILARYLALATRSELLSPDDKQRIAHLLTESAEITWAGRREFDPDLPMSTPGIDPTSILGTPTTLFSPNITHHISDIHQPGAPLELSNQLTSWMILEAAATLTHPES